jgi:RimJ/RimL family protein N-acetyltransferase
MFVIETARLGLRRLDLDDASFILDLLNQESFIRHIGDKGVRNLDDARNYLVSGPLESYRRFGFGLYCLCLRAGGERIGICGLVKRETLADVDVGFALLPQYGGHGYATEAARAVLDYARAALGLGRIVGITAPENYASIAVLEKIGLRYERSVAVGADAHEVRLYGPSSTGP